MLLEHERNYGLGVSILGQTWGRRVEQGRDQLHVEVEDIDLAPHIRSVPVVNSHFPTFLLRIMSA